MMTVKIERNLSLTEVKNRFLRRVMATKKMQWLQVCTGRVKIFSHFSLQALA